MIAFNLIIIFSFLYEIISNQNVFLYEVNDAMDDLVTNLNLTTNLNIILGHMNKTLKENRECIENIDRYYRNDVQKIEKLYSGSSKGFVDMNSFIACTSDKENTFFSIYPNWTKEARMEIARLNGKTLPQHLWIFGVCLKNHFCTSQDIAEIFDKLNELFENPFELYRKNNITVEDYREAESNIYTKKYIFGYFIPFFLLFFQIIFMAFKIIPVKLFQCYLRRKYIRDIDKSKNKKNLDNLLNSASLTKQIALKIRQCFSISDIIDDLLTIKKNELFKDEDMTYIKGIKTIGIILFIFGFSFTVIYNYPLCLSEVTKRVDYMTSNRAIILIIAFRLSPALILSASGYSLSYKFLNFLDKKLGNIAIENSEQNSEQSKEENNNTVNNINTETSNNSDNNINRIVEKTNVENSNSIESSSDAPKSYYENTLGIKFYTEDVSKTALNKIFQGQKINENVLSEISTDEIPYSLYFNFILRQWHKLVVFEIGMLSFRLSFPLLIVIMVKAPLIHYIFKTYFERMGSTFFNMIYVGNLIDLFSETDGFLMMQLFGIPVSEFSYFMIGTVLIFICYKKKKRLDIILCLIIVLVLIFKFVYIFSNLEERNPAIFYTDSTYQRFFFNPLFNFEIYVIGMLFGMMNYVVQNGIINKKSLIEERPFVKIPVYLSQLCDYKRILKKKKNNNFIHFIFIIILLLFSIFIIPLLFKNNFETYVRKNEPNTFFVILSLIDIQLFTYCFHFFAMSCYVSGKNIFFEILNANVHSYGLRFGFWVVLATPATTFLVVYSNEANVNLSFFMVLIYGSMTLINTFAVGLLFFLVLEMPYKKLVKLYFNITTELNKVYLEDETEEGTIDNSGLGLKELNEKDLLEENGGENNNKEDDDEDEFKD